MSQDLFHHSLVHIVQMDMYMPHTYQDWSPHNLAHSNQQGRYKLHMFHC